MECDLSKMSLISEIISFLKIVVFQKLNHFLATLREVSFFLSLLLCMCLLFQFQKHIN